jgi:beta-glucanase (GH16 family)
MFFFMFFSIIASATSMSTSMLEQVIKKRAAWNEERDLFWSNNCDWVGNEIRSLSLPGERCGGECAGTAECTHFSWQEGTCFLKRGPTSFEKAIGHNGRSACGIMKSAPPPPPKTPWRLVWSDEFNGTGGIDSSKWSAQTGGGGWGNNELEFYTDRVENAYQADGNLNIKAIKETYKGRDYTSARLVTQNKFTTTYGRVEARIKIPYGQGIWPAFWMLGANIGSVGWPSCGEIDIMENVGNKPSIVHGTIHGPGYAGGAGIGATNALPNNKRYADSFHVFAVEWEQNVIRIYRDDVLYVTRTPADLPPGTKWVFDHDFYILLNLAVGGGWPGNPDGSTVFPQTMQVDYVRVYQRS